MKAKRKCYEVRYERDEDGWWVATVKNAKGVHTQAKTMAAARKRIREALSAALGHNDWDIQDVPTPRRTIFRRRRCWRCNSSVKTTRENRVYDSLPSVVLMNLVVHRCTKKKCGEYTIEYPSIQRLNDQVRELLIKKETALTFLEIRFLLMCLGRDSAIDDIQLDDGSEIRTSLTLAAKFKNAEWTFGPRKRRRG